MEKPVRRKRYAVQDSYEFDARERFEAAFETVLAGRILRDPQTHSSRTLATPGPRLPYPPTRSSVGAAHFGLRGY
jgi:hypothetical protein